MKIIIASNNENKIKEIKDIVSALRPNDEVVSMSEIGFGADIYEYGNTFSENSSIKAKSLLHYLENSKVFNEDEFVVLADDSGLCVNALNGAPGVMSARYADDHNDIANNWKLLSKMAHKSDRSAYFITVVKGYYKNKDIVKDISGVGRIYGTITTSFIGENGFAYDPLFFVDSANKTFAEMNEKEKNTFSHRRIAFEEAIKNING